MYSIEETDLAGIGKRFIVNTASGNKLVIVTHDSGEVELYHSSPDEPSKPVPVATLDDQEARLVAAIIGKTIYQSESIERLARHGVTVSWHQVKKDSHAVGKSLKALLKDTDLLVLAAVDKDGKRQACPSLDYVLNEDTQIALAGSVKEINSVKQLMDKGA